MRYNRDFGEILGNFADFGIMDRVWESEQAISVATSFEIVRGE